MKMTIEEKNNIEAMAKIRRGKIAN